MTDSIQIETECVEVQDGTLSDEQLLLRYRKVVPEGFENVFTLTLVLALFQASNYFLPESGIMAGGIAQIAVLPTLPARSRQGD